MGVLNTLAPALALAPLVTAVAATYTVTSDCFLLRGALENGTDLGFFNVADQAFDIHAAFVSDGSLATKLGIDASTGNMVDYNDGDVDPGFPHKGLIASTEWEGQYYSDYIYFEPPQALQDQETAANVALDCELSPGNILSCSHPHPKRPNYNVFQYCTHWGNDLEIGTPDNPASCASVVLSATAATGCTPPTTTPSVGSTTTRTTTTLPTSTVMPHPRFVCLDSSTPICSDGFLVRCDRLPWNVTTAWYQVFGSEEGSEMECHQSCVNDATCGGWKYYEEFTDLHSCSHTHETISPSIQFREEVFHSVGIKGGCQ
ncbi:hypothetical protein AB5N19_06882 [Seiridium cardinale]